MGMAVWLGCSRGCLCKSFGLILLVTIQRWHNCRQSMRSRIVCQDAARRNKGRLRLNANKHGPRQS